MTDGRLTDQRVTNVYDSDGKLLVEVVPPYHLQGLAPQWFLRDSATFVDFPTTAAKAQWFYERSGGESPDGVIGITPEVLSGLLKLTGPVVLPKEAITVDAESIVEVLEAVIAAKANVGAEEPKSVLTELTPLLIERISVLARTKPFKLIAFIGDALVRRQLVLTLVAPAAQAALTRRGWDGSLPEFGAGEDFLAIARDNVGGTKVSTKTEVRVSHTASVRSRGTIEDSVSVTFESTLPRGLGEGSTELMYVRLLIPKGSILMNIEGFLSSPPFLGFAGGYSPSARRDPDAEALTGIPSQDYTGIRTGEEHGATVVAGWLLLPSGETRSVRIIYELPFRFEGNLWEYRMLFAPPVGVAPPYQMESSIKFPKAPNRVTASKNLAKVSPSEWRGDFPEVTRAIRYGILAERSPE